MIYLSIYTHYIQTYTQIVRGARRARGRRKRGVYSVNTGEPAVGGNGRGYISENIQPDKPYGRGARCFRRDCFFLCKSACTTAAGSQRSHAPLYLYMPHETESHESGKGRKQKPTKLALYTHDYTVGPLPRLVPTYLAPTQHWHPRRSM